jgi:hypothetical protein
MAEGAGVADVPPTPGAPSDAASQARRLFRSQRWAEAADLLRRVANGEAGDDRGNRQIAEFNLAIALYRLRRTAECTLLFRAMARRDNHFKHQESFLWLVKLVSDGGADVAPSDFAGLCDCHCDYWSNVDGENMQNYICGRWRFQERDYAGAATYFARVSGEGQMAARACFHAARLHTPR